MEIGRSARARDREKSAGAIWKKLVASPTFWILPLALVLRLPRLGESLWFDEAYYSTRELFGSWSGLTASFARELPAPIYRLVLFGWVELFGEAEWVVRIPSLLCGLGSIALVVSLARERGGERLAVAAGLWLALSPVHVWYSQEGTPYAMALFLLLAAVRMGDRIVARPSAGRVLLFAALLATAILTHYFVAAFIASFALAALFARSPARWRWLIAVAAVGGAYAWMLRLKAGGGGLRMSQGFLREFDLFEAWMLPFHYFLHGNCLWTVSPYRATAEFLVANPWLVAFQVLACALLVRGTWLSLRTPERSLGLPLVAHFAALPAAVAALGFLGYRQLYIERYLVFALPLFAVLLLRGAIDLGGRRVGPALVAALLVANAAAYVGWWVKDDRWTVYKQNPDWRAAAAGVVAEAGEASRTIVVGTTPAAAMGFHLRRLAGAAAPPVTSSGRFLVSEALSAGRTTVYLVENLYWRGEFRRDLQRFEEDPRATPAGELRFRGVVLHRFELADLQPAPVDLVD